MNLLPESRKKELSRLYYTRLAVVGTLLFSGVFAIHAALTVPTTLHFLQEIKDQTILLAGLGEQLAGSGEKEVSARVKTLNDTGAQLVHTATIGTASGAVRAIINVPHPGVRITGLSFTAGTTDDKKQMKVVGTAASRESLRSYAAALGAVPYISTADLPISAYAKETDIDFAILLTGTLAL